MVNATFLAERQTINELILSVLLLILELTFSASVECVIRMMISNIV